MPLAPGSRLGPYEVLAPLGAVGMGDVYRARDTKLGRYVALKILPDSFAHDPERVARFRREAQVLASLNHGHIAAFLGREAWRTRAIIAYRVTAPYDPALPRIRAASRRGPISLSAVPRDLTIASASSVAM